MKRLGSISLALFILLLTNVPVHAQSRTVVKLATIAPNGTSPHQALLRMRDKWRAASGGKVEIVVRPDGVEGGESESIKRMRVRQIHAALLTVTGLAEIEPSTSALQNMPMAFQSLAEVDYVQQKFTPEIEKRFSDKNFVILSWGDLGWVRFFTKKPLARPAELKTMKVFTWAGDPYQADIMKTAGYNPRSLETAEIFPGLQNGLIDAVPAPPMGALAGQFDSTAKNMLEINWGPLVVGIVIDRRTWDTFPKDWQEKFREAARQAGDEIRTAGRAESDQAVIAMKKRGLQVKQVTPEIEAEWRKAAEEVYPKIRGTIVPSDMFDRVQALLKEYRSSKDSKK